MTWWMYVKSDEPKTKWFRTLLIGAIIGGLIGWFWPQ